MKPTKQIRLSLLTVLALVSLLSYQNCAPGALNSKSSSSTAFSDCGGSVCEVVDTNTVAVVNSQNVLSAMVNKAGVVAPSNTTKTAFTNQSTKLPETGSVSQITAPMWMAVATIGSEVCNDLINQETATGATRRVFNSVDFTLGPASLKAVANDSARNDVIRRMARSFWSRNESAQELALIKSGLDESFTGATAGDTKKEMLYACIAMISSTDAIKY